MTFEENTYTNGSRGQQDDRDAWNIIDKFCRGIVGTCIPGVCSIPMAQTARRRIRGPQERAHSSAKVSRTPTTGKEEAD